MFKINLDAVCMLEELTEKVERVDFMLTEFMSDYSKPIYPDPEKALEYFSNTKAGRATDEEGRYSAAWNCEYNRIQQLIAIAFDFNLEALQLARDINEQLKEQKEQNYLRMVENLPSLT